MGKLGKKARKFAKKNLQSVHRKNRKTNSMFKRKSSKSKDWLSWADALFFGFVILSFFFLSFCLFICTLGWFLILLVHFCTVQLNGIFFIIHLRIFGSRKDFKIPWMDVPMVVSSCFFWEGGGVLFCLALSR